MSEAKNAPVSRLRRLLRPGGDDWANPTAKHPLAPYGQHSDEVAAWVNFQDDLRNVLRALELLAGQSK